MVVAGRAAAQHGERLIDVLCLRIARNCCAGGIRLLDEVVSVVSKDTGPGGRRFVDSSAEGVVFEGNRSASAWERHARKAVLEVPCVDCHVRPNNLRLSVAVVIVGIRRAGRGGQLEAMRCR